MNQRRWLCRRCSREWVYAHHWADGDPCPACRGIHVEQVEYAAAFPGGDIPRAGETQPLLPSPDAMMPTAISVSRSAAIALLDADVYGHPIPPLEPQLDLWQMI